MLRVGVVFAAPETLLEARRYDGKSFFCPNGHSLSYKGEKYRLERELKAAKERAEREAIWHHNANQRAAALERSRNATRGVVTRMRKRLGAGCCPACRRHFTNLERHMACKHPGYAAAEERAE